MPRFTESVVEDATLEWLSELGWTVMHGEELAPGALRADYTAVVLADVLQGALRRLNPGLPDEALADAHRRLMQPEGATGAMRNRAVHQLLVDGVTVESRA